MKRFITLVVLVLTNVSGAYAGSIQFTDGFEGSTLDPFWNANVQSGSITLSTAKAHSGVQSVQFSSVDSGEGKVLYLIHNFTGMMYGEVSVWFYDTGAGMESSNNVGITLMNSQLASTGNGELADLFADDYDYPGNGDTYVYGTSWQWRFVIGG